jgi:hypothetical protein
MTANPVFGMFMLVMAIVLAVIVWRMARADKENVRLWEVSAAWPTVPGIIGSVRVSFWTAFIAVAAVIVAILAIVMMRLES